MAGNLTAMIAAAFSGSAAPPVTSDPYYEYTTLLLPGNGTNGAQNNTFLDSSTNNFTITRNGNTTQGTFSPFSQTGWSNYFNGSSNLETPDAAALHLGTGDFTVEGWVYATTTSTTRPIYGHNNGNYELNIALNSGNNLVVAAYTSGGSLNFQITSSTTVSANSWFHFALVRSGSGSNNIVLYIDGVSRGTATYTGTMTNGAAGGYRIARDYSSVNFLTGYISNLRVVKGRAVYTSAFTPPTSPLGATSGGQNPPQGTETSLLTCQSNRFVDNSTNNFTITTSGSPSVQAFSPFNPSASWSAATYGGSGYFDGTGDYLTGPSNAAFDFSTGTFSVEFWVFPSDLAFRIYLSAPNNASTQIGYDPGNGPRYLYFYSSSIVFSGQIGTFAANQWNHIVLCRSGTTLSMFCNGARVYTNASYSSSINFSTPYVGEYHAIGLPTLGYMSNLRFVKGSTPYDPTSSTITVPTAPLTNITNTSLLLNFTNAGIYDATSKNDLETVADAKISTAINNPFGASTGSMYFDGTGDYLVGKTTDLLSFNTGDFTVEMWIYPNSVAGAIVLLDTRASASDSGWAFYINSSSRLALFSSNADRITSASALTASTWTHIVLARSGSTLAVYMNGVQSATATYSTTMTCPGRISIASGFDNAAPLNGYLQDFRITKGYARYTANFTPPTAAFPTL